MNDSATESGPTDQPSRETDVPSRETDVPSGETDVPSRDDLGFARVDSQRAARTGDAEVVYGQGKLPEQIVAIVARLRETGATAMVTRAEDAARQALRAAHPDADIDDLARTVVVGELPEPRGSVLVLTAGTADLPVAREAVISARVHGAATTLIADVGVAGLHRLLAVEAQLHEADCLVVVAGMEGALPSVVGGLTGTPLVAVPSSTGYGVAAGGFVALAAMLSSCSPGVAVVNIDNGYGAGVFAARVARGSHASRASTIKP